MINCRDCVNAPEMQNMRSLFHLSYSLFLCPPPLMYTPRAASFLPPLSLASPALCLLHLRVNTSVKLQTWFFQLSLPIKKWNLILGDRFHYTLNEFIGFRGSISRTEILLPWASSLWNGCGKVAKKLRKRCGMSSV